MKWLKLAGIAAALALLFLVGAAAYVVAGNSAWLKTELAKAAREQWRRTLAIEGELELSFWPDIGFRVGKVRVSEAGADRTFATIESARLSVATWPLLDRKLVVRSCELDGLDITLVRRRDGTLNFADLLPGATTDDKDIADQSPWKIDIAAIRLANARLAWLDEQAGKTASVSALTLTTGHIVGDTAMRAFHVDTPHFSARLDGDTRSASVRLTTPAVDVVGKQWKIAGLDLGMDARIGETTLSTQWASAITVDPSSHALALDDIAGRVDIAHPRLPTKSLALPIAGRLSGNLSRPSASGALSSRLDGSSVALRFDVARFAPLSLVFDLGIDRVDLDKYLARDRDGDDGRIDLSALKGMDIRGDIRIGRLRLGQVTATNITLAFDAAAGALDLTPRATSAGTARRDDEKRPARPAGR